MTFRVGSAGQYDGRLANYALPEKIGHYSTDSEKFCDDSHQMKYLSMPDCQKGLHMDLNDGYSEYIVARPSDDKFLLLRWIRCHEEDIRKKFKDPSKIHIDIICSRSVLVAVSSSIYEKNNDWMFHVTKFRSTIYIYQIDTEEKVKRVESLTERDRLMISWGLKFEQYITSNAVDKKPNTSLPANENEHFYVILKGQLEGHRLLLSCEVDALDPQYHTALGYDDLGCNPENEPASMIPYVELKTSKNHIKKSKVWFRMLKWYLQAFLTGVPRVICGMRNKDGIVQRLITYKVWNMPKACEGLWSRDACLNFCSEFFDYVKQCAVKDDPKVVYKFYWKPGSDITCEELGPEHQLLPDWYINSVTVI